MCFSVFRAVEKSLKDVSCFGDLLWYIGKDKSISAVLNEKK